MAKFLDTTGVSYHLESLIKSTKERLVLVSPYLQISDRIREHIQNLNTQKRDIRIIFRENKLSLDESNWLGNQIGIRTSLCKNLHAKCYLNESEAIITSMNLYEFSQVNNNEMGVYISKEQDPDLYNDAAKEVQRLLTISDEIRVTVQKVNPAGSHDKSNANRSAKPTGYCIRTGTPISFNIEKPLSADAFKSWSRYSDPNYSEKFCHFSGEPSNGDTSVNKPILKKNWSKAKEVHGF